jgi:hypothetical protein
MIYPTSTDYELLYDLVQQGGKAICLIDEAYTAICEKIEHDTYVSNSDRVLFADRDIGVRGSKYIFAKNCKEYDLQWIVPTTATIGEYTIQIIPYLDKRAISYRVFVYWNNDINYYAYFGDTKLKQFKYLDSVDYSDIDIELTIEAALKQGLEIVKNLKNNLE